MGEQNFKFSQDMIAKDDKIMLTYLKIDIGQMIRTDVLFVFHPEDNDLLVMWSYNLMNVVNSDFLNVQALTFEAYGQIIVLTCPRNWFDVNEHYFKVVSDVKSDYSDDQCMLHRLKESDEMNISNMVTVYNWLWLKKDAMERLRAINKKVIMPDPLYVESKKDQSLKEDLIWSKCLSIFDLLN